MSADDGTTTTSGPSNQPNAVEIPVPGWDGYLKCPSGRSLYCVTHAAAMPNAQPLGVLVFFQAFTEERKASHRSAVRLAAALAAAGITTHRLDLPGCGESTGRLEQLQWADWLADAAAAADALYSGLPDGIARWLGGIRMGATVAGLCRPTAETSARPLHWLAVAPILQGAVFLRHLRTRRSIRSDLTAGNHARAASEPEIATEPIPPGSEEFDGFLLNGEFLTAVAALELPRDLARTTGAAIQAGPATAISREFQALADSPGRTMRVSAVRQEPVWERGESVNDRPLIEATVRAVRGLQADSKTGNANQG